MSRPFEELAAALPEEDEELPEEEKDYDRQTALETLRLIQSMGFEIRRAE